MPKLLAKKRIYLQVFLVSAASWGLPTSSCETRSRLHGNEAWESGMIGRMACDLPTCGLHSLIPTASAGTVKCAKSLGLPGYFRFVRFSSLSVEELGAMEQTAKEKIPVTHPWWRFLLGAVGFWFF